MITDKQKQIIDTITDGHVALADIKQKKVEIYFDKRPKLLHPNHTAGIVVSNFCLSREDGFFVNTFIFRKQEFVKYIITQKFKN